MGELHRPDFGNQPERKEAENKEKLKKVRGKLKFLRNALLAGVLTYGAGTELYKGAKLAAEGSNFENKSAAGQVVEGSEVALSTLPAAYIETVEDIEDTLQELGVEDVAQIGAETITLKEPTTLRKIAEDRVIKIYSFMGRVRGNQRSDYEAQMDPFRAAQAEVFARHWARINGDMDPDAELPAGTVVTLDNENGAVLQYRKFVEPGQPDPIPFEELEK